MKRLAAIGLVTASLSAVSQIADATTQTVFVNQLNSSTPVATPLLGGDTLIVDTVITGATGALSQTVTFSTGAGVGSFTGAAAWEVANPGPRLTGVNIDLFDNVTNSLVASDTFQGLTGSFAVSSFASTALLPSRQYRLVATGTAQTDTVLDISLSIAPIPEPVTSTMLLAGLLAAGLIGRRRLGGPER